MSSNYSQNLEATNSYFIVSMYLLGEQVFTIEKFEDLECLVVALLFVPLYSTIKRIKPTIQSSIQFTTLLQKRINCERSQNNS